MPQIRNGVLNPWIIRLAIASLSPGVLIFPNVALAQSITLDGTLGSARTLSGSAYRVRQADGRTVGRNLFHSFGRFNLHTGESVTFESGSNIRNIISRVTGGTPSAIDGLIQTQNNTVNLFLINPSGIVFGQNASLNIGGSFVASTANSFRFANGDEFSAIRPQAPSLLMISVPIGLQYGTQPGAITSQASLSVGSGRSLLLAGGAVHLTHSQLEAGSPRGGRIELGGVADAGVLGLNSQDALFSLSFPVNLERANVSLNDSTLDTRAADGGEITITGHSISILEGSRIQAGIAAGDGFRSSQAGDITLDAARRLRIDGGSLINNTTAPSTETSPAAIGNAGSIRISTGILSVHNGSKLDASTFGRGNAGSVMIDARDRVEFEGDSYAFSSVGGLLSDGRVIAASGRGGDIHISTGTLSIRNGAQLDASTSGSGNAGSIIIDARDRVEFEGSGSTAFSSSDGFFNGQGTVATGRGGDIRISTGTFSIRNGAELNITTTGRGNAGSIIINARDRVEFEDGDAFSSSGRSNIAASGRGGDIRISTSTLSLRNSAQLVSVAFGRGNAGSIVIDARDRVEFAGGSAAFSSAGGFSNGQGIAASGRGGDIRISTGTLLVRTGAQLDARTLGRGNAGSVIIAARDRVEFENGSAFSSSGGFSNGQGFAGSGNAGDVRISTGTLVLRDGAQLVSNTLGQGDAGGVTIAARDRVEFTGGSAAFSSTGATSSTGQVAAGSGNAGDIRISTGTLLVRGSAQLISNTLGRGDAGGVTIEARDLVTLEGSNSGTLSRSGGISPSGQAIDAAGHGGDIHISTRSLTVRNGAQLDAATFGSGDAGGVTIEARDRVEFEGSNSAALSRSGGISPSGQVIDAAGHGGDIYISTRSLTVRDGASVVASTLGRGDAGSVRIESRDRVVFDGGGAASSSDGFYNGQGVTARGRGGDVHISTDTLLVNNGTQLTAESTGTGSAGNIFVSANAVTLDRSNITTETRSGNGGNITLRNADLLLLLQNGRISTSAGTAQSGGNGGNIALDANLIVASADANNDITANAFSGAGGTVNVTGQLVGLNLLSRSELQARLGTGNPQNLDPSRLSTNDITAISQTAPTLNGQATVNAPDVDPSRGLVELPTVVIDPATQIAQGCTSGRNESSRFVTTGRGGLPLSPDESLRHQAIVLPAWVTLSSEAEPLTERQSQSPRVSSQVSLPEQAIVEADRLGRDANGRLILATRSQTSHATPFQSSPAACTTF